MQERELSKPASVGPARAARLRLAGPAFGLAALCGVLALGCGALFVAAGAAYPAQYRAETRVFVAAPAGSQAPLDQAAAMMLSRDIARDALSGLGAWGRPEFARNDSEVARARNARALDPDRDARRARAHGLRGAPVRRRAAARAPASGRFPRRGRRFRAGRKPVAALFPRGARRRRARRGRGRRRDARPCAVGRTRGRGERSSSRPSRPPMRSRRILGSRSARRGFRRRARRARRSARRGLGQRARSAARSARRRDPANPMASSRRGSALGDLARRPRRATPAPSKTPRRAS